MSKINHLMREQQEKQDKSQFYIVKSHFGSFLLLKLAQELSILVCFASIFG